MIRVAVETATGMGTVAVARGDRVLAEIALGDQSRHSESVLPALETALSIAGLERSRIDEVVVGGGPGSFTGVRVAAATTKGLVAVLERPLLAYSSLLALAAGVPWDGPVCALFDARRGEVYAGCWAVGRDGVDTVLSPLAGLVESVVEATAPASPLFVGDGALRYRDVLLSAGVAPGRVALVPTHPRASVLLWLAEHHRSGAVVADVPGWEPTYVRGSSARKS